MNFGAFVASRENDSVGTVERVVLDLATNEVLFYVVHKTIGHDREVIVSSSAVSDIDDDLVLNLSLAEVENLADYVGARWSMAQGLPGGAPLDRPGQVEVSARTIVQCIDGDIGTVQGVIVDEMTAEVTDLIVQLEDRRRRATIPMAWAASLRGDRIKLQCTKAEI